MAAVNPETEPPDAVVEHKKSNRLYRITRKGGELWHQELLLGAAPEDVVLAEHPVKYVVGSGRHARTYLAEAEGFLVQSPVTWYASRKLWDMSPGYDRADHAGFERAIGQDCLICHAGRSEAIGQTRHQVRIHEAAISCERCHGPGSLHVALHSAPGRPIAAQEVDYTIVNPEHLSRELKEAVCQQCHLRVTASVLGRGRQFDDFRPGLPLQDFRQDYRLDSAGSPMTVVGHVEQLHLSRCYTQSRTLTCLTCHDPHAPVAAERRLEHYRGVCLSCHQSENCKSPPEHRLRESPANDCVQCHMPSAPTEVVHVAFTQHRIGLHAPPRDRPNGLSGLPAPPGELRPFLDLSRLPEIDRERSLGLAYLGLVKGEPVQGTASHYRNLALKLLEGVQQAGLNDPAVDSTLARWHFEQGNHQAAPLAERALGHPDLNETDRCTALFVVAAEHLKQKRYRESLVKLQELVRLRRHSHDWLLIAECEKARNNIPATIEALEHAVRINPSLTQIHQALAGYFRQAGLPSRAEWHERRSVP